MGRERREFPADLGAVKALVGRWQNQAAQARSSGDADRAEVYRTCIVQLLMQVFGLDWAEADTVAWGNGVLRVNVGAGG